MKDPSFLTKYAIKVNEPLAAHTALGVGGNADFFVTVTEPAQLTAVLKAADKNNLKAMVIGGGTSVVFSDHGFRGLVIENKLATFDVKRGVATAGSGLRMPELVHALAKFEYGGLEPLVTVPGTVGGAIWGNAGSDSLEIKDVLKSAKLYSRGSVVEVEPSDLRFGYRDSRLKHEQEWVIEASFDVEQKDQKVINKAILLAQQRKLKMQPPSRHCASIFRNPLPQHAGELSAMVGMKGQRVGGAVVSRKHANFIMNEGNATARDVYELAQRVKNRVSVKMGVNLKEQIEWVGEW